MPVSRDDREMVSAISLTVVPTVRRRVVVEILQTTGQDRHFRMKLVLFYASTTDDCQLPTTPTANYVQFNDAPGVV